MKFKAKKTKKGMSIVEVVISVALIAILLIPIANVVIKATQRSKEAELKQEVSIQGQKLLEEINSYDNLQFDTSHEFTLLDGNKLIYDPVSGGITGNLLVDGKTIVVTGTKNNDFTYATTTVSASNKAATEYANLQADADTYINIYQGGLVSMNNSTLKLPTINNKMILRINPDMSCDYYKDTNIDVTHEPVQGDKIGSATAARTNGKLLINLSSDGGAYDSTMQISVYSKATSPIIIDILKSQNVKTGKVNIVYKEALDKINVYDHPVPTDTKPLGDLFKFSVDATVEQKVDSKTGEKIEFSGTTVKNVVLSY